MAGPPVDAPAPAPLAGGAEAVCHRCGGSKRGPFVPCKSCGFTPLGEDRAVAWLFSEHHLDAAELAEAAGRVIQGERPEPSRALRDLARAGMGAQPVAGPERAPLDRASLLRLALANLLLTPLVGLAVWFGLGVERPVAARQALRLTLPMMALFVGLWVLLLIVRL